MQISRFQISGRHPGEDFDMQNPNLQSKISNSFNQREKSVLHNFKQLLAYAHIKVVITFFVVDFVLVITRSHEVGFGRNLVGIDPTSLPDISTQLRDLSQTKQKMKLNMFEKK